MISGDFYDKRNSEVYIFIYDIVSGSFLFLLAQLGERVAKFKISRNLVIVLSHLH